MVYDAPFTAPTMPRDGTTAVAEAPVGKAAWDRGDALALRITLNLDPAMPDNLQGRSTGDATITWEATNR